MGTRRGEHVTDRYGQEFTFLARSDRPATYRFRGRTREEAFGRLLAARVALRGLLAPRVAFPPTWRAPAHADMTGCDFSHSSLREVNLAGANLANSVLVGADLSYAVLWYTILNNCDLSDARLEGCTISGDRWLGVTFSERTTMPDGHSFGSYLRDVMPNLIAAGPVDQASLDGLVDPDRRERFCTEIFAGGVGRWLGPRADEFRALFVGGVIPPDAVVEATRTRALRHDPVLSPQWARPEGVL